MTERDWPADVFDISCRRCARLARFLDEGRARHPDYHLRPVPPFGDPLARLLVVGLAPGYHGANATGRPFTGDHAGILLYRTLHRFGFASCDRSVSADDDLRLRGCRITNAVKCVPPQNKPATSEIRNCNDYLSADLGRLPAGAVVIALGTVAHRAVLQGLGLRPAHARFGHGAEHALPRDCTLLDSYHCSRYNTQTGRLTAAMFEEVFARARALLDR
jgi:uracil-DNA glycosylase family 4